MNNNCFSHTFLSFAELTNNADMVSFDNEVSAESSLTGLAVVSSIVVSSIVAFFFSIYSSVRNNHIQCF